MKLKSTIEQSAVLLSLVIIAIFMYYVVFAGRLPGGSDLLFHLGKIRILMDTLPKYPLWNPYWYFGCPFLRFWPPLSYLLFAAVGWIMQLSVIQAFMVCSNIVFAIGAVSTYLLAREIKLSRLAGIAASLLFLTSYSLHWWWGVGQLPNVTAVMIMPFGLLAYLRAIKKQTVESILFCGVAFFFTILIHLYNTLIFALILIVTSIALIIDDPRLVADYEGPKKPPRYTLRLPKIFLSSTFIATVLSLWWWLPFFFSKNVFSVTSYGELEVASTLHAIHITDFFWPSWYHAGVGHFILAMGGVFICFTKREKEHKLALSWLILSIVGGLAPYLQLPIGLPFRFGPYIALFFAILGGFFLEFLFEKYEKLVKKRALALTLCGVIIIVSMFMPMLQAKENIGMIDELPKPQSYEWLENHTRKGERIAESVGGRLNIYTMLFQSMGGGINEMTNEFTYTFWYYIYYKSDSNYVSFLSKNFNVKYFILSQKIEGLNEVDPGIYEVQDFNSSFVEVVDQDNILVLIIGDHVDYMRIFQSIAPANPQNMVLVKGGTNLEEYDLETINRFDVIYLYGLRYGSLDNLVTLLKGYLREGGGIILDTSILQYGGEMENVPDPFPITETHIGNSQHNLTWIEASEIGQQVNLTDFSKAQYHISYTETTEIKDGAQILIKDEGRPVVVYWDFLNGKVLWCGLGLPYHAMTYENTEESKLLCNMINYTKAKNENRYTPAKVNFNFESTDRINISIQNFSYGNALWVKMSYYEGWRAYIDNRQTPIFLAGPDMMLIFPDKGEGTVIFQFEKTILEQLSEYVSIMGIVSIPLTLLFKRILERRKKRI